MHMEKIYIGLVDTPGFFAGIIRRVIKQDYIHVVIGMDEKLDECYSVGRRHPSVPIIAGFEREEKDKILRAFPTARYMIFSINCTKEQKKMICKKLRSCYQNRFRYHYCVIGLPFILFQKKFYQQRHYTCSSFVARVLENNGIDLFEKHFSLVTPKDFYELKEKEIIYEGQLADICADSKYDIVPKTA